MGLEGLGVIESKVLVEAKQQQVIDCLKSDGIDLLLVFVREGADSVLTRLITGVNYVVHSAAFIITAAGERIAILEPMDKGNGAGTYFDNVICYKNDDVESHLVEYWKDAAPSKVALPYSPYDYASDGLTHGMYLRLANALGVFGFEQSIVSAEKIVSTLRAIKTSEEQRRVKRAAELTVKLLKKVGGSITPGITDTEIASLVAKEAGGVGLSKASGSIAVNPIGENNKVLRNRPIRAGETIVCDTVATLDGYSSDIKWLWYVACEGESIPARLLEQWEACKESMETSLHELRPGRPGYEIHEIGCSVLEERGFRRDGHAYGHQVGLGAHDAGPYLGDRANKYRPSEGLLKPGMIVTLDPTINRTGVPVADCYCMGIEVMAEVTDEGGRLVHEPQKNIDVIDISCA